MREFYGAQIQFNVCQSLRHVLHVLFYTFTSHLPFRALTQCHDVHSPTQEATGSVKASNVFFLLLLFFTSPLAKSVPQRALLLVTLVLIACMDMGQHNRFKHAQPSCLGKMEGGREAIAFRLSKLLATCSLASACRDEKNQSYAAL